MSLFQFRVLDAINILNEISRARKPVFINFYRLINSVFG